MGWDMVIDVDAEEKIETVEMCGDVQRERWELRMGWEIVVRPMDDGMEDADADNQEDEASGELIYRRGVLAQVEGGVSSG